MKYKKTDYHDFTTKNTSKAERVKLYVGNIWINAAKCKKCGDTVRSVNLHDYTGCSCGAVHVDGGSHYARRVGDPADFEDIIEYYNELIAPEDEG